MTPIQEQAAILRGHASKRLRYDIKTDEQSDEFKLMRDVVMKYRGKFIYYITENNEKMLTRLFMKIYEEAYQNGANDAINEILNEKRNENGS